MIVFAFDERHFSAALDYQSWSETRWRILSRFLEHWFYIEKNLVFKKDTFTIYIFYQILVVFVKMNLVCTMVIFEVSLERDWRAASICNESPIRMRSAAELSHSSKYVNAPLIFDKGALSPPKTSKAIFIVGSGLTCLGYNNRTSLVISAIWTSSIR